VEKTGKASRKLMKIGRTINQAPTLGPKKNSGTMGFKHPVGKHARKGMMVQMPQDGILKSNHLLFDELFK
jgi:hypothetical protein